MEGPEPVALAPEGGVEFYAAQEFKRVAQLIADDLRDRADRIEREMGRIGHVGGSTALRGVEPKIHGYGAIAADIVKQAVAMDITVSQMIRSASEADAYRAARLNGASD